MNDVAAPERGWVLKVLKGQAVYISNLWVPITRFFGARVKWNGAVSIRPELFDGDVDHDGDGFASAVETMLRTNPLDYKSRPRTSITPEVNSLRFAYSPFSPFVDLLIEASDDMDDWVEVKDLEIESGMVIHPHAKALFYRATASSIEGARD